MGSLDQSQDHMSPLTSSPSPIMKGHEPQISLTCNPEDGAFTDAFPSQQKSTFTNEKKGSEKEDSIEADVTSISSTGSFDGSISSLETTVTEYEHPLSITCITEIQISTTRTLGGDGIVSGEMGCSSDGTYQRQPLRYL